MAERKYRAIVAEDHAGVRQGIVRELSRDGDIEVVGEAAEGTALLALLKENPCDLITLDLSMPGSGGLDVLGEIGQICPGVRVIVYSLHNDPEHFLESLARGVRGYVVKDEDVSVLKEAARRVLRGDTYFSPSLGEFMRDNHSLLKKRTALQLLSEREHEVLADLRTGMGHDEIGRTMGVSREALDRLIARIMQKVGARNDAGLIEFAQEMDAKAQASALPGIKSGHAVGPGGRSAAIHSA